MKNISTVWLKQSVLSEAMIPGSFKVTSVSANWTSMFLTLSPFMPSNLNAIVTSSSDCVHSYLGPIIEKKQRVREQHFIDNFHISTQKAITS